MAPPLSSFKMTIWSFFLSSLMALYSSLEMLGFGGLALLKVQAQFCHTSSTSFSGRCLMLSSMLQMISSTGIFLGAIAKLRPFSRRVREEELSSALERLTTSRFGSLNLFLHWVCWCVSFLIFPCWCVSFLIGRFLCWNELCCRWSLSRGCFTRLWWCVCLCPSWP